MADRSEDSAVASQASQASQASNVLTTKVDPTSARYEANMRFLADLMSQVRNESEKIAEGGGAKGIENQHGKGRLTARERIAVDRGEDFGIPGRERTGCGPERPRRERRIKYPLAGGTTADRVGQHLDGRVL